MELALNLIWAILAVASYARLFRSLATLGERPAREPSPSRCLLALTCVLAILFPVISLSDDLHEVQATLEEASPSVVVIKKCVGNHSANQDRTLHQPQFIPAPFATNACPAALEVVPAQLIARTLAGQHVVALGRAPPLFR